MQNLSHGDWMHFENLGIVNVLSISSLDFSVAKPVLEAKSQLTDEKIIPLNILHLKYFHKRISLPSDTVPTALNLADCLKVLACCKGLVFVNLSQEISRIASKQGRCGCFQVFPVLLLISPIQGEDAHCF